MEYNSKKLYNLKIFYEDKYGKQDTEIIFKITKNTACKIIARTKNKNIIKWEITKRTL